jgi:hypothetical protein
MKQSDYKAFVGGMLETAEAVDKALSPEKYAVYFKDLADIDIRAFLFAMEKHRKESKFFPKVAEIRDLAKLFKAPAHLGVEGREVKLLESQEMTEERRQKNLKGVRELIASLTNLDAQYGTNLQEKVNRRERLALLEQQKKEILG